MNINELAQKIYQQNVERGWWDDPDRCMLRTFQLVNTEIAEATEADRKSGGPDSHLPHRSAIEVEYADTFIRLADLAGRYGWLYKEGMAAPCYLLARTSNEGARQFVLTYVCCQMAVNLFGAPLQPGKVVYGYCQALETLLEICRIDGYDLWGAVKDKLEYNRTRFDHSREARAHANGKRY